jgi:pyruvate/2-oxoglutarate dehydrogenase complex dihydrolipoamide dehydrogenase (E3) component
VLAGDQRIKARRFVIATGSSPAVPPIPGLDGVPYFTNETIFENGAQLDHLIIIGGGPIGLELAQAYLRLGSRVTVLEALKALGKDDPELSDVVLKRLRAEGVEIREGALVERVTGGARLVDVHISRAGCRAWSRARTCSSPPGAAPTSPASTSRPPASSTTSAASR